MVLLLAAQQLYNLQLLYTRRLDVIWDQITSNLLVYNLQLTYNYDGHIMVEMVIMVKIIIMFDVVAI